MWGQQQALSELRGTGGTREAGARGPFPGATAQMALSRLAFERQVLTLSAFLDLGFSFLVSSTPSPSCALESGQTGFLT